MTTAAELSKNSHQGFAVRKQTCIRAETDLSRNLVCGCGHIYDETPVDIAVYVRNDPVNFVDPDGRFYQGSGGLFTGGQIIMTFPSLLVSNLISSSAMDVVDMGYSNGDVYVDPLVGGGGGYPQPNPSVSGTGLPGWLLSFWFNVNTNTTDIQRRNILQTALDGLLPRLNRSNCASFLSGFITKLSAAGILGSSITSIGDLITQGLNKAGVSLYGAVHDSGNLGSGQNAAFAQSDDNTIYLGEHFYTQGGPAGADATTTIIHETLQLGLVSANGKHISDFTLDSFFGDGAAGSYGNAVSTNCGTTP